MLELLRSPLIWIGPLVLPIENEPPAAAWLREWLQLFRLETRLPWPTHAESLTIVELGNGVLLCLKDPKGMNMSTARKRGTCFYLLPFCLPF